MKNELNIKYRCYNLSLNFIKFINSIEIKRINYPLIEQLYKSVTSIGANIIEGKSGSSKKDLIKFYQIALKSANESKYWFCLLRDAFNIDKSEINNLLNEINEISKIIAGSIITLKKNINKKDKK